MLSELHIKNFALIDEVYLYFDKGLNILTGETGAGKTVIIEAMNLLLGKRADPVLIGSRDNEALVEASFSSGSSKLILSRLVSKEGKNKCYVNGKLATLAMLAETGGEMVDFHGQHEHQALLKVSTHLDYLDRFGGESFLEEKEQFVRGYQELKRLHEEMDELRVSERERISRIDLLKFQIDEIGKANLRAGEDEELERERLLLQNAEKLHQAIQTARQALIREEMAESGAVGAAENVELASQSLSSIAHLDEALKKMAESLEGINYQLQELAGELRAYSDSVEFDPQRLDEVESRLSVISLFKKKYGDSIEEILRYKSQAEGDLSSLENSATRLKGLEKEEKKQREQLEKEAFSLSQKRKKLAKKLEEDVEKELKGLNLKHCHFRVHFDREEGLTPHGMDKVEFLISPNPGEPLKPLAKIASGGEVSRIMLALKIALIKADPVSILIFDEIDSGIGGKTAAEVGKKLVYLSSSHQIVCITHLPQIASFADRHFFVSKEIKRKASETKVMALDSPGKLEELSRMLSGVGVSDITKKHAEELLLTATATKEKIGR